MKKNLIAILTILTCIFISLGITACENNDNNSSNFVVVSFDTDGGQDIPSQTLLKGSKIEKPICEKDGYTFLEWRIGDEKWLFEQSRVYENITLKAYWVINYYDVVFVDYDGTILDKQNIEYGQKIDYNGILPNEYIDGKKTYKFIGWDIDFDIVPSNDLTITAKYEFCGDRYNVTYLDANDQELYIESVLEGESATYSVKPPKAEEWLYKYSFRGWDADLSNITQDITVKPIYDKASVGLTIKNGIVEKLTHIRGDGTVLIPNHWDGMDVKKIAREAFYGNADIKNIIIPEGIIEVGLISFCDGLQYLTLPSTVKKFEGVTFSDNLITVYLNDGLEEISSYAFRDCEALQGIIIPKTVTFIGNYAFLNNPYCAIYLETETIPNTWSDSWNLYKYPTYYYSETENKDGYHWHYSESGNISFWR